MGRSRANRRSREDEKDVICESLVLDMPAAHRPEIAEEADDNDELSAAVSVVEQELAAALASALREKHPDGLPLGTLASSPSIRHRLSDLMRAARVRSFKARWLSRFPSELRFDGKCVTAADVVLDSNCQTSSFSSDQAQDGLSDGGERRAQDAAGNDDAQKHRQFSEQSEETNAATDDDIDRGDKGGDGSDDDDDDDDDSDDDYEGSEESSDEDLCPNNAILQNFDLDGIVKYITDGNITKVVVMCGAGISTSAGIPDFRSPGTGLYHNLQRFKLPCAEAIFTLNYFRRSPDAFYELCKEMWPGNFKPTSTHYFLRLLHEKGLLLRCYTQNIDSLEGQAGLPPDKIVAAHGNFDTAHVIDTNREVSVSDLRAALDEGTDGWRALEKREGGLVKPGITFFGEDLPERFARMRSEDMRKCELLIVMGTSLEVYPFADLVGAVHPKTPRLLINRNPAGLCDELQRGFRFHRPGHGVSGNHRDVFHRGDCDEGTGELLSRLGWEADLDALIDSDGSAAVPLAPWV